MHDNLNFMKKQDSLRASEIRLALIHNLRLRGGISCPIHPEPYEKYASTSTFCATMAESRAPSCSRQSNWRVVSHLIAPHTPAESRGFLWSAVKWKEAFAHGMFSAVSDLLQKKGKSEATRSLSFKVEPAQRNLSTSQRFDDKWPCCLFAFRHYLVLHLVTLWSFHIERKAWIRVICISVDERSRWWRGDVERDICFYTSETVLSLLGRVNDFRRCFSAGQLTCWKYFVFPKASYYGALKPTSGVHGLVLHDVSTKGWVPIYRSDLPFVLNPQPKERSPNCDCCQWKGNLEPPTQTGPRECLLLTMESHDTSAKECLPNWLTRNIDLGHEQLTDTNVAGR